MAEKPPPPGNRELVICVLNEPDYLHNVLTAFVEAGVTASTIIESQGMGSILAADVPIFAGFRHMFAGAKPYNHTIYAVVDGPAVTQRLMNLVQDVLEEVEEEAKGIMFSLPVTNFIHLSGTKP